MTAKTSLAALLLLLAIPAWAWSVRCTTSEVKSLGRLEMLCDVGEPRHPATGADLYRAVEPQDPAVGGALPIKVEA
jgi:hypothetical protein